MKLRPTGVEPIGASSLPNSDLSKSEKSDGAKMGAIDGKHPEPFDGIKFLAEQLAQLSQSERSALVAVLPTGSRPIQIALNEPTVPE